MPKQKLKKAVVKRMKLTKTGKVKRHQAFHTHRLVRRTTKRKRQLRAAVIVTGKIGQSMRKLLGGA